MTIARITDAYVRYYTDTDRVAACVEWLDIGGRQGRTETLLPYKLGQHLHYPPSMFILLGRHMEALFRRANREGIAIRGETW